MLLALLGGADALSVPTAARPPAAQLHATAAPRARASLTVMEVSDPDCGVLPTESTDCKGALYRTPPFKKVMAANRAEIAVRIHRACTELNIETVAIYGYEDRFSMHRWGCDQSFMLKKETLASPISAYLDIDQIIGIAKVRARTLGVDYSATPRPHAPLRPRPCELRADARRLVRVGDMGASYTHTTPHVRGHGP